MRKLVNEVFLYAMVMETVKFKRINTNGLKAPKDFSPDSVWDLKNDKIRKIES